MMADRKSDYAKTWEPSDWIHGMCQEHPTLPRPAADAGALRSTPPPVVLGAPPLFSQPTIISFIPPSCSSTGVQNHEFSKSLKPHREEIKELEVFKGEQLTNSQNCFPKKPVTSFSPHPAPPSSGLGKTQHSQGFPSPIPRPLPLPEPAPCPLSSSLLPVLSQAQSRTSGSSCGWSIQGQAWGFS